MWGPGCRRGDGFVQQCWYAIACVAHSMAYGYGFTVTPLQLASAYVALAGHGSRLPLSILKQDRVLEPQQVFDAEMPVR